MLTRMALNNDADDTLLVAIASLLLQIGKIEDCITICKMPALVGTILTASGSRLSMQHEISPTPSPSLLKRVLISQTPSPGRHARQSIQKQSSIQEALLSALTVSTTSAVRSDTQLIPSVSASQTAQYLSVPLITSQSQTRLVLSQPRALVILASAYLQVRNMDESFR